MNVLFSGFDHDNELIGLSTCLKNAILHTPRTVSHFVITFSHTKRSVESSAFLNIPWKAIDSLHVRPVQDVTITFLRHTSEYPTTMTVVTPGDAEESYFAKEIELAKQQLPRLQTKKLLNVIGEDVSLQDSPGIVRPLMIVL